MKDQPVLQNRRELFYALVDAIDAIVWEAECDTLRYLSISERIEWLLGYHAKQWLSQPTFWPDHIHPRDRDWVVTRCQQETAEKRPFTLEYRMMAAGDRMVWVRDVIRVVVENGRPLKLCGARIDITERKQTEVLHEFARIVGASLEYQDIVRQSLHQLSHVLVFDTASIYLNRQQEPSDFIAIIGFEDEEMTTREAHRLLKTSGVLSQMARDLKPVISPDVRHLDGWIWVPGATHVRSFMAVPLVTRDKMIGALMLDSKRVGFFRSADLQMVETLAQHIATALENAWLFEAMQQQYEETSHRAKELTVLHQVALATATIMDVDELLRQTTEMIAASLYPDVFGFTLLDETSNTIIPHPSYHGISERFSGTAIPLGQSIVGLVAQLGVPRIVADVHQEPLYFKGVSKTRSEIAVPLKVYGRVIGVINVESPQVNAFSDNDLRFLVTLAGQVAAAIERARLYETLQKQADDLAQQVAERTAELQIERDRTLTILESAGEGIVLTDAEANILYVNPAMEQQSGYSGDELLNQNPRIFASGQTSPAIYREMWDTVLDRECWSGELINRRKDGAFYDTAVTITPILDTQNQITGFVSVQSDISRLKELDRLKTQFVSNVSHELRTPLTNIKMYLTLLERGKKERHAHYLGVLNHEAERLERLIKDLLDISHLDTQPSVDWHASTDLNPLVHRQINSFAAKAEAKQITLKLDLLPDLPAAQIEAQYLERLLANLLGNAVAYSPKGGKVVVSAGEGDLHGGSMVWFSVSDNGPGIPSEEMAHLFERFSRGQASRDSGTPGTGLGLAICKEIVDRYGGYIDVESKLGQGANFTAWLPAAK